MTQQTTPLPGPATTGRLLGAYQTLFRSAAVAGAAPAGPAAAVAPADRSATAADRSDRLTRLALGATVVLSLVLNLWGIDRTGYANQYYAATVLSMLQSWRNFFFGAFDPGGYVTVDKPPLGFMIQAAFAKVLGFSGVSILLPEALAGAASVALLYHLVARAFGRVAGLLAALALAVTPVAVAVNRNNTIDSLLVLTVLLGVWAAMLAAERGKLRWLVLAAVAVGVGFMIKMLQAYLVAPAIFALYLAAAPRPRLVRFAHVAVAGAALLAVTLAWPIAVDLTPADQRPYVGSTQNNSALSLALGYNGLERLLGHGGSLTTLTDGAGDGGDGGMPGGFGGPGGYGENGNPGALRLFNAQLGGQTSWLLPLALVGLAFTGWAAWTNRRSLSRSRPGQAFILWGLWLAAGAGFFSVAGFYHRYYLVMLAPPVAALAAAGVGGAWRASRRGTRFAALVLPAALVGAALVEARLLGDYPTYASWLTPLVLGAAVVAAAALLAARFGPRLQRLPAAGVVARAGATLGVAALLVAPAVWSGLTAFAGQGGGGPIVAGGPQAAGTNGGFGGPPPGGFGAPPAGFGGNPPGGFGAPTNGGAPGGAPPPSANGNPPAGMPPFGASGQPSQAPAADAAARGNRDGGMRDGGFGGPGGGNEAALIAYLQANRGTAKYLVATSNANSASGIILATGQPVMALGGFTGSDPILTVDELVAMVRAGEVRFFTLGGFGGGPGGPGGSGGISAWVQSACVAVPASDTGGQSGLYDCGAVAGGT